MLSEKMQNALNDQIKHELDSAYVYLSMAAYFEAENLPGFAHWMYMQREEELEHAMKLFRHVNERGGRVKLQALDEPPASFKSPLDVFEKSLKHEQKVTALIHELYDLALKEKDYPAQVMLQWFIDEQVEEEDNAGSVVDTLKRAGDNDAALLMLDRELAKREPEEE